ncbi:MAG: carbohydrate-binding domain-containing protein, partial [Candidatus Scatosoma sp.]
MNFKKFLKTGSCLICCMAFAFPLAACKPGADMQGKSPDALADGRQPDEITDNNEVTTTTPDVTEHNFELVSQEGGVYTYRCADCEETSAVTVACVGGTENACTVENGTMTFSGLTEESVYSVSGEFYGNIVIDAGENQKFELELSGLTLSSFSDCPITVLSGDKVTLSAKKDTENYIYDLRETVDSGDETAISSSVYALCDLDIQGKGKLFVTSTHNNGIHTKDDLKVKNLTLQVECKDNALKGNDSVTIESGSVTLIAKSGDGIKTTNSDVSSKGNQRGTVAVSGGDILVYAACDGIDAAYDVQIDETDAAVNLQIFTDKYSKYSEEVTAVSDGVYYIRFNSTAYSYSLKFYNDGSDAVWRNSSSSTLVGSSRYYPIQKPGGYAYVQLYIYSGSQQQGQGDSYTACTEGMAVNNGYDTIALSSRGGSLTYGWTNYTTQQTGFGGGHGGFGGGMNDGNTDKGDYSTKGIKAANAVNIEAGNITVKSYDDGVHANNDTTLESGETPLGNVDIAGGTVTLQSNDDGIHADGRLTVSGGTVNILSSYEGLEGETVNISGGNVSAVASDDGVNGTATSGTAITVSGGILYVYANGDGVDSNSTASYAGILFSGGKSVIISTSSGNS